MKYRKSMILLVLTIFIFGAASVCASDVNDTVIANENNSTIELSQADADELISLEEDELIDQTENVEEISEENSGTFAELQANIKTAPQGSILTLNKSYECEDGFDNEGILINQSITIDGNGFEINAQGISRIFTITADNVILKNIIFTKGKTTEPGGAVYFQKSGTVTNCNFTDNEAYYGGAICFLGEGTVTNCNFTDNNAVNYGSAVYFSVEGSVENCSFTNNSETFQGGAIRFSGKGTVTNCNFTNNSARYGGAIFFYDNGEVTDCNFVNNSAIKEEGDCGGAIRMSSGSVENCNFTNNRAAYRGGAVYISEKGNFVNCSFEDNSAAHDGGAISSKSGTFENCNFTGNAASNDGGAVYLSITGNVTNCHFTDNSAPKGGAVYFLNDNGNVTNCSFVANTASNDGGAVFFMTTHSNVTNCYFEANSANRGGAIFCIHESAVTADSCIFKNDSDNTINTCILSPILNAYDFYSVYGSGEKLTFNLTTNSGMAIPDGNISMTIYFKDNDRGAANYTCLSGEGWTVDLPVGSYYAVINTEYKNFEPLIRTIEITMPDVRFYINVTSITTNNMNVNITAKSNIPKNLLWDGKLLFIVSDGTNITASYAGNGTWWALHEFNDDGVYQVNALYTELSNVTTNNARINISRASLNLNASYTVSVLDDGFAVSIIVNSDPKINGDISIKFNGKEYPVEMVNGTAKFTSKKVYANTYNTAIYYAGSDEYKNTSTTVKAIVKTTKVSKVNNFNFYYYNNDMGSDSEKGISIIKVVDKDGNPIKKGTVTITIMNKYKLKVKTDANGIAKFTKAYKPGTYSVTATHNNKVTNLGNLVLKSVVNLPKVTKVSKTAKTTTIKITLKGTGPIKGKTVVVSFMKVNYKVQTDKNGAAQFKVTQNMVSKLAVGKTYTIRATYRMDSVAQSIQILK